MDRVCVVCAVTLVARRLRAQGDPHAHAYASRHPITHLTTSAHAGPAQCRANHQSGRNFALFRRQACCQRYGLRYMPQNHAADRRARSPNVPYLSFWLLHGFSRKDSKGQPQSSQITRRADSVRGLSSWARAVCLQVRHAVSYGIHQYAFPAGRGRQAEGWRFG